MRLSDYIHADMPILDKDTEPVKFTCDVVCDCGRMIYASDNFCPQCGAGVTPEKAVVVKIPWEKIKAMVRPLIEEEYKKRHGN